MTMTFGAQEHTVLLCTTFYRRGGGSSVHMTEMNFIYGGKSTNKKQGMRAKGSAPLVPGVNRRTFLRAAVYMFAFGSLTTGGHVAAVAAVATILTTTFANWVSVFPL